MKPQNAIRWCLWCLLMALAAGVAVAADISVVRESQPVVSASAGDEPVTADTERAEYTGTIRIYIVEQTSRWGDSQGQKYHFGFLDWGLVEAITVPDNGVWRRDVEWNATAAGWSGVTDTNIQATVALFNSAGYTADAYPGYGYWFTAHNADATAAAEPGAIGRNLASGGFTHTVFVEQGSATW